VSSPPSTVRSALSPLRPKSTAHSLPPHRPMAAGLPGHRRQPPHCHHHYGAHHAGSSLPPTRHAAILVSSHPHRVAQRAPRTSLMPELPIPELIVHQPWVCVHSAMGMGRAAVFSITTRPWADSGPRTVQPFPISIMLFPIQISRNLFMFLKFIESKLKFRKIQSKFCVKPLE
jgi:hypothetical protein